MSRKALGFNDESSGEEEEEMGQVKSSRPFGKPKQRSNRDLIAESLKNQAKSKQYEEANPEIYEYDEVYDDIVTSREAKKPKIVDDGGSKYMDRLLEAKKRREMDKLHLQDLKVQKEREAEGDEFKDKEVFVTGAYKEFQNERRKEHDLSERESEGVINVDSFRENMLGESSQKIETPSIRRATDSKSGESSVVPTTVSVDKPKSVVLPKHSEEVVEQYRQRYLQRKAQMQS